MSDETDGPLDALVGIVAVGTLPAAALAAIFVGGNAPAVVAIVGWFLLVPVLSILSDHVDLSTEDGAGRERAGERRERTGRGDQADEALDRLRERYATGEIDDVEFERRLERLVETEDVEVRGRADTDLLAGSDERSATADASECESADRRPERVRKRDRERERE